MARGAPFSGERGRTIFDEMSSSARGEQRLRLTGIKDMAEPRFKLSTPISTTGQKSMFRTVSGWFARIRRHCRAAGAERASRLADDLDGQTRISIWMRVRGFISLVREIVLR